MDLHAGYITVLNETRKKECLMLKDIGPKYKSFNLVFCNFIIQLLFWVRVKIKGRLVASCIRHFYVLISINGVYFWHIVPNYGKTGTVYLLLLRVANFAFSISLLLFSRCSPFSLCLQVSEVEVNGQIEAVCESVFSEMESQAVDALDLPVPGCFRMRSHSYVRAIEKGCSQEEQEAGGGVRVGIRRTSSPPRTTTTTVRTIQSSTGQCEHA